MSSGKYLSFPLRIPSGIGTMASGSDMDYASPPAASQIYVIAPEGGTVYPLVGVNQVILKWYLQTMPTNATFCSVTPISARGLMAGTSNRIFGLADQNGTVRNEIFRHTFHDYDTTNNRVNIYRFELYKTAADGTNSITMVAAHTFNTGTRHAIPVFDPYLAFWFRTDGDAATGSQSLSVDIGWA